MSYVEEIERLSTENAGLREHLIEVREDRKYHYERANRLLTDLALCEQTNRAIHEQDAANVAKLQAIRKAMDEAGLCDISDYSGSAEWMQLVADIEAILDGDA